MPSSTDNASFNREQPGVAGQLEMRVTRYPEGTPSVAGKSVAHEQFFAGALKILRPHYLDDTGQVCYTAINPGGAYFGGDDYRFDIHVTTGASLLLTSQSATKVYRTPTASARQFMTLTVEEEAILDYLPDQLIVYQGGSYEQITTVTVAPSSQVILEEILTPGWSPQGVRFSYESIRLRTTVYCSGDSEPALVGIDQLRLVPRESNLTDMGYLEGYSHLGQLVVIASRDRCTGVVEDLRRIATQHTDVRAGVSVAGIHAKVALLVVRSLGATTGALSAMHSQMINHVREAWRGQGPVDLRKY